LVFSQEEPRRCAQVFTCNIAKRQQQLLQEWIMTAQTRPSIGSAGTSKELLRNEFNNRLKPQVLQHLKSVYLDTGSDLAD
ncbi:serine/threonine protein kinase, partial [filamentous cyanobacterium CCT1]